MKLKLNIQYYAADREWLCANFLKADGTVAKHRMETAVEGIWTGIFDVEPTSANYVDYYYSVQQGDEERRREWQMLPHRLEDIGSYKMYNVRDIWYDMPEDAYLYSSAFTQCIHNNGSSMSPEEHCERVLRVKVRAPQLHHGERLVLVGDDEVLGAWHIDKAVRMYEHAENEWVATIDAARVSHQMVEYKFVVVNDERTDIQPIWEDCDNRCLKVPAVDREMAVVIEVPRLSLHRFDEKFAGTAVPVFSLRSEGSFGVGDFGDLKLMVDWVKLTGQRILQILPINDTTQTKTWVDSYPYSCISIFALHPMYCDLRQLPAPKDDAVKARFEQIRQELNALKQIDYERVNAAKNDYLACVYAENGKAVLASAAFKAWFKEEQQWLVPYAQYCVLRDKYGTANYHEWPANNQWSEADRAALTNSRSKAYREAAYFYYVQYVLAQQMKGAHEHARQSNVVLKGDIPIGVNRNGCDAWMEPRYFNMNGQAGAPPDSFSVNGQNWGFPTYNWEEMLSDDCAWWVRRFSNMAKYFDAYRIDHVLGFFRIWEIPIHSVHGLLGQFAPALGMTVAEIEAYGLRWDEELMLEPLITDWILDRWFGPDADAIRHVFLDLKKEVKDDNGNVCDHRYAMKPEFDTQRKVEAYFAQLPDGSSKENIAVRDTLYSLISNVLFLRDHRKPDLYHPRISSQLDPCYEYLWDDQKQPYNNIYNDYFYRRNNQFWYKEAMKKLPRLVNATQMLVCAEDLGMVPDCVPWVMNELKILSLEIQTMPKETNLRFGKLSHNPYRSVCTISSHDTATMRMWWEEDAEQTQEYYHTRLRRGDKAPETLPGWLARDIIYRHLACPSMLCILTLQDWLAMDETLRLADTNAERINIPANPKHYWRYRMHLNIEQLLAADEFNYTLRELIKETNR